MRGRSIRVHMAHLPGQCALAQTPDGSYLLTSGVDGTLRPHDIRDSDSLPSVGGKAAQVWWRQASPKEPNLSELPASDQHEKPVTSLALSPDCSVLASASADGFVRLFQVAKTDNVPNVTFMQSCARFAASVRTLDFSPSGMFLAAAGEEPGVVKVIMTAQPTNINVLRAPPKSAGDDATIAVAFDPSGDFVLSVGERGGVAVWNVDNCAFVKDMELNGRKAHCLTWAPDGQSVLVGTDRGAVIVPRETWVMDFLLEDVSDAADEDDDDTNGLFSTAAQRNEVSAVAWSSNGRYGLTATRDSTVSVWDVHQKKILGAWKAESYIQSLAWHSKANAFVVIDSHGQWGIVSDVVPEHMPPPQSNVPFIELPSFPDDDERPKQKSKKGNGDNDDDDEGVVKRSKVAKSKKEKIKANKKRAREASRRRKEKAKGASQGPTQDEDDDDDQQLENGFKINLSDVDADEEDDVERDGDSESLSSQDSDADSASDEEIPGELADLENSGVRLPQLKKRHKFRSGSSRQARAVPSAPDPFMPASTPLSEKASKKVRILAWNLVGAVLSFDENTHDVVEVEFAEATRRTLGIKDHFGYTVGCLSETGVFLGSHKTKEHGAVISFRPFNSWAQNADWTQFMPENENIAVIALGDRFAAVVTTPNCMVRLFSLSGLQTSVYAIAGNVVTAAAAGDMLGIVFCEPDSVTLRVEILEISSIGEPVRVVYNGPAKIGTGSALEWVGFTNDTQELCMYDSYGWLWMLTDASGTQRWIPVVQNGAKGAGCDWLWAISATAEMFIGAPCLSNERYPPARPRPGPRSVQLSAPVIERVTKSGKPTVVERLLRTKLSLHRAIATKKLAEEECDPDDDEVVFADEAVARIELEADKCLLSMMQDACHYEYNMRALDLATRLNCKVSFKYAIDLAEHYKRMALLPRVQQVAEKKMALLEEEARANHIQRTIGARVETTSPVSRQTGHGDVPGTRQTSVGARATDSAIQADVSTPTSLKSRKLTPMNFDHEERDAGQKGSAANPSGISTRKSSKSTTPAKTARAQMAELTDDDDDDNNDGGCDEVGTTSVAEVKPNEVKSVGTADSRGTKRRTAVAESQASQKVDSNENETKKAKVDNNRPATTNATCKGAAVSSSTVKPKAFQSFTNRFLKK